MKNDPSRVPEFDDPDLDILMAEEDIAYPGEDDDADLPESEIERVMQKYEQNLLSIDGVVGIGIQTNKIGNDVIAVYLRDKAVRKRIPGELDGFSVETVISGEFDAY